MSWEPEVQIVSDDVDCVAAAIQAMSNDGCCLIITTGGTGPAPRDITPEATERVCSKMLPGFGEMMRQVSLRYVPTAILSRQTAGVCGGALVVNLPGRPKSIWNVLMQFSQPFLTALISSIPEIPHLLTWKQTQIECIHFGQKPSSFAYSVCQRRDFNKFCRLSL